MPMVFCQKMVSTKFFKFLINTNSNTNLKQNSFPEEVSLSTDVAFEIFISLSGTRESLVE